VKTVGEAVEVLAKRFGSAGIDTARLDARVLVAFVLGVNTEKVFGYPETELTSDQHNQLEDVAKRRENREPLARIVGEKEFWSLPFKVSRDTLIPRPDSECLVEAVLDHVEERTGNYSILDLGTGTGCLLISLLHELKNAKGVGVDISQSALQTASDNAQRLDVGERAQFIKNNWCDHLAADRGTRFDVVLSNPPYIPDGDIDSLEPEVNKHEPLRALVGGADGLDIYRMLIQETKALINPEGLLIFEVGAGQSDDVVGLGRANGFNLLNVRCDLAGVERCVLFKLS
jgi:release factor glutamine methyltransferase